MNLLVSYVLASFSQLTHPYFTRINSAHEVSMDNVLPYPPRLRWAPGLTVNQSGLAFQPTAIVPTAMKVLRSQIMV